MLTSLNHKQHPYGCFCPAPVTVVVTQASETHACVSELLFIMYLCCKPETCCDQMHLFQHGSVNNFGTTPFLWHPAFHLPFCSVSPFQAQSVSLQGSCGAEVGLSRSDWEVVGSILSLLVACLCGQAGGGLASASYDRSATISVWI